MRVRASAGAASFRRQGTLERHLDAARAQVWGDGTNSTGTVAGTTSFVWFQTSKTANHTVYGRVPAQQNAASGAYTDTIVVTITF